MHSAEGDTAKLKSERLKIMETNFFFILSSPAYLKSSIRQIGVKLLKRSGWEKKRDSQEKIARKMNCVSERVSE